MGGVNRCRCGREIPYAPERKNQFRYCADCRAKYGALHQHGKNKKRLTLARQTQKKGV